MSDHLPPEIILQILLKLPVDSLLRCTAVCQSWYSLITSPGFISTHHLSRAPHSQTVLFRHYTNTPPKKEHFSLHSDPENVASFKLIKSPMKPRKNMYTRIVGSLHGLVCLSDDLFGYTYRIVIWNPSIRKHIHCPKPSVTYDEVGPYMFVLGFGYDSGRDDYKVVRLVYAQGSGQSRSDVLPPLAEVFAIKEKAWRRISAVGVDSCMVEPGWTQCFLQGRVHWVSYQKKMHRVANCVLMFDMADERFRKMKLPKSLIEVNPIRLSVSGTGGLLTIFHYNYVGSEPKKHCDIWVRTQYNDVKSWSKMYTVDVLGMSGVVLGLSGNDEILLVKACADSHPLFEVPTGELISYNTKTQGTQNFGVQGIVEAFYYTPYLGSLVLLNKDSHASSDGLSKKGCEKRSYKIERYASTGLAESNIGGVSVEEQSSSSDTDGESNGPSDFELMFRKIVNFGHQMMKLKDEE